MNWGLFYSEAVGWGARRTLPRALRQPVYTAFARAVGAELDEVELPLEQYPSLGSFFTRRLREGARVLANGPSTIVSPCDGKVASVGHARDGRLIQAKGRDYSLADLVVDPELAADLDGGPFLTIYLSPRDYHRVHTPARCAVSGYSYVPGTLYPVSPGWAQRVPELFARNERVVIDLVMPGERHARAALVMVGAAGVGNIGLMGEGVETRALRGGQHCVRHEAPRELQRGAELGCFHLGSTVVLVFQPGTVELHELAEGERLRFGQPIARMI